MNGNILGAFLIFLFLNSYAFFLFQSGLKNYNDEPFKMDVGGGLTDWNYPRVNFYFSFVLSAISFVLAGGVIKLYG